MNTPKSDNTFLPVYGHDHFPSISNLLYGIYYYSNPRRGMYLLYVYSNRLQIESLGKGVAALK